MTLQLKPSKCTVGFPNPDWHIEDVRCQGKSAFSVFVCRRIQFSTLHSCQLQPGPGRSSKVFALSQIKQVGSFSEADWCANWVPVSDRSSCTFFNGAGALVRGRRALFLPCKTPSLSADVNTFHLSPISGSSNRGSRRKRHESKTFSWTSSLCCFNPS